MKLSYNSPIYLIICFLRILEFSLFIYIQKCLRYYIIPLIIKWNSQSFSSQETQNHLNPKKIIHLRCLSQWVDLVDWGQSSQLDAVYKKLSIYVYIYYYNIYIREAIHRYLTLIQIEQKIFVTLKQEDNSDAEENQFPKGNFLSPKKKKGKNTISIL